MKHLYHVANMKCRERYVADETDFQRMMGAVNLEEIYRVLHDTDYGLYVSPEKPLEKIFEEEKYELRREFTRSGLPEKARDILFLSLDFFNLRILLKKEIFGMEGSFYSAGKKEEELKKNYPEIVEEGKSKQNTVEIDDFLTEKYLEKLLEKSKKDRLLHDLAKKYKEKILAKSGDAELVKIEDEFISKARYRDEGIAPLFAYIMLKIRAEKIINLIYEAKKVGLPAERIYPLIKSVRAL